MKKDTWRQDWSEPSQPKLEIGSAEMLYKELKQKSDELS
jgi:hypothetical protein